MFGNKDAPKQGLYVIHDTVAEHIVGFITVHKHDAAAIRMFVDVAAAPNSSIAAHPEDYQLVRVGYIDVSTLKITTEHSVVLSGKAWAAARDAAIAQPDGNVVLRKEA